MPSAGSCRAGRARATLRRIEDLGGTPLLGRRPVADLGFSAYVKDPEGNVVGLWETAAPA
jgi:predicted enzyme related to lactoylglutathione lyase